MTIRVGSTGAAGSALTFDNALTLTGTNVQWGGSLVANTTITNNGFDVIYSQASSRSIRINSSGSFQISNGGVNPAFQTLPTGFLGAFAIAISPAGTAITQNAYIHVKGVSTGSDFILRIDNSANTQMFGVTENGIVSPGFRIDFVAALGSIDAINANRRLDFDLQQAANQGFAYNFKMTPGASTVGAPFSFMITSGGWGPNAGTDTFAAIHVTNSINQTGTSAGKNIGFYFQPGLTSLRGRLEAFESTAGDLVMTGLPLTGSLNYSLIQLTQSWNTSGVVSLIDTDVSYTTAGAGSMFIKVKKSGVNVFTVDTNGNTVLNSIQTAALSSGAGVLKFGKVTGGVSWEIEVDGVTYTVTVT